MPIATFNNVFQVLTGPAPNSSFGESNSSVAKTILFHVEPMNGEKVPNKRS